MGKDDGWYCQPISLAPPTTGAFHFFNHLTIGLKRHPIPGTIDLHKVALISYLAGNNQQ